MNKPTYLKGKKKVGGELIDEMYEWMMWNGFKMNDRQKHEMQTIMKKFVNMRTEYLAQQLQEAQAVINVLNNQPI